MTAIDKTEFGGFMARLAFALPRFAPDVKNPAFLSTWYEQLSARLTLEDLRVAYNACVAQLDQFPSIREVLAFAGKAPPPPPTGEDKGREVAERIWHALARGWGSSHSAKIQAERDAYVGEVGLMVVRLAGGWMHLASSVQNDEETTRKAQWREMARIGAEKGGLGPAPTFDRLPSPAREGIKALTERATAWGADRAAGNDD